MKNIADYLRSVFEHYEMFADTSARRAVTGARQEHGDDEGGGPREDARDLRRSQLGELPSRSSTDSRSAEASSAISRSTSARASRR